MGHGRGSATNSSDGRLHSYRDADGRELLALGVAMAIQENGTDSLDYFAMLRGWGLAREGI